VLYRPRFFAKTGEATGRTAITRIPSHLHREQPSPAGEFPRSPEEMSRPNRPRPNKPDEQHVTRPTIRQIDHAGTTALSLNSK